VFQCHGSNDEVVPIALARRLFEAAPGPMKQFYEVPFARHNDSHPPAYYDALANFLERVDSQCRPLTPHLHSRERHHGRQFGVARHQTT
jgi:hypothetical protein